MPTKSVRQEACIFSGGLKYVAVRGRMESVLVISCVHAVPAVRGARVGGERCEASIEVARRLELAALPRGRFIGCGLRAVWVTSVFSFAVS